MSIKFAILEMDGTEYFVPTEMDGRSAVNKAGLSYHSISHVTSVNTTSSTDVLLEDMEVTLQPGKYLVDSYTTSNNSGNNTNFFSLYLDGVQVPDTEQRVVRSNSNISNLRLPWYAHKEVVVTDTPKILQVRWRRTNGTATCYSRFLKVLQVGL